MAKKKRKSKPDVWIAEISVQGYDWMAAGANEEEAVNALRELWNELVRKNDWFQGLPKFDGAMPESDTPAYEYFGMNTRRLILGKAYITGGEDE